MCIYKYVEYNSVLCGTAIFPLCIVGTNADGCVPVEWWWWWLWYNISSRSADIARCRAALHAISRSGEVEEF